MTRFLALATLFCFTVPAMAVDNDSSSEDGVLRYTMNSLSGKPVDLSQYKGKVILIVNTASRCGLTPQYAKLQKLYENHKDDGLVVLGFPCNQFGRQEPGTSKEISEFCTTNYGVTFDMFEKIKVNGDEACDLYKQLTSLDTKPEGSGDISWNFEKFLVGKDGKVVARFQPRTSPDDNDLMAAIKAELAK